jgi:dihydroxyacetone kinase
MFIMTMGNGLKTETPTASTVHTALATALQTLKKLGKSDVGDKTMIDTLAPFIAAYGEAAATDMSITAAWLAALPAADEGRESTVEMVAKRGRSAVLREKSRGSADPGATSMYYMLRAVGDVLRQECPT